MPNLLFFSRICLIANLCFLLSLASRFGSFLPDGWVESTVIILGTVLAIVLNAVLQLALLTIAITRRQALAFIPLWLRITNFLFLLHKQGSICFGDDKSQSVIFMI